MARNVGRSLVAGLGGVVTLVTPTETFAASLSDVTDTVLSNPTTALAVGFVGGVVVTGAAVAVVSHVRRTRAQRGDSAVESSCVEVVDTSSEIVEPVSVQDESELVAEPAPVADAAPEAEVSEEDLEEEEYTYVPKHLPRVNEPSLADVAEQDEFEPESEGQPEACEEATASKVEEEAEEAEYEAASESERAAEPETEAEKTPAVEVQSELAAEPEEAHEPEVAAEVEPKAAPEPETACESEPAPEPEQPYVGRHAASDYEEIALNYVRVRRYFGKLVPLVDENATTEEAASESVAEEYSPELTLIETVSESEPEPVSAPKPLTIVSESEPKSEPAASRSKLESLPMPEVAPVAAAAATPAATAETETKTGPRHATNDYEQIAQNYVERINFREKMARRAAGVAASLTAHIEANKLDGVPTIERADPVESTAEHEPFIPNQEWWNNVEKGLEFEAQSDESQRVREHKGAPLSERVPFVDEGVYPRQRTVDELNEVEDPWESALQSLDDRILDEVEEERNFTFEDVVGTGETLDEPDGLEPDTAFIPFKMPAGHPEVIDTDSYVDYLIEDEFSKNPSKAVRRTSKRFLRVLEGGTQSEPAFDSSDYEPRHFASSGVAAEA